MKIKGILAVALFSSLALCRISQATTLNVSVSGHFSSTVTSTMLSAPGATWSVNFFVPSTPTAANPDSGGFDTGFTGFSYKLNGASIAAVPASIRFATTGNLGLFTVFFGPESGFDSNGNAIPEFSFQGSQAFTGATTSPAIVPGTYTVSDWIYSDIVNFDEHVSPGISVAITTATPEPSADLLVCVAGGALLMLARFRRRAA